MKDSLSGRKFNPVGEFFVFGAIISLMAKLEKKVKKAQEENELILGAGQESNKKAKPFVEEMAKGIEVENRAQRALELEALENLRKRPKIFSYKEQLCVYMANLVREGGVPQGWGFEVEVLEKGVGLKVLRQVGSKPTQMGYRKFAISGEAVYDYSYAQRFADWAIALMQKPEEKRTESGIILSN